MEFLDFWLVLRQHNLFTWNPKTFVTSLIDRSFGVPVIVFLLSRGQRKCELGEIHFEKNENPFMSRLKPKWRWLSLLCNILSTGLLVSKFTFFDRELEVQKICLHFIHYILFSWLTSNRIISFIAVLLLGNVH